MFLGRVPVYLNDMSFKVDRSKEDQPRVVVVSLRIQPFTKKYAEDIHPPMVGVLWSRTSGERRQDMPNATFNITTTKQRVRWYPTPEPQEDIKAMEFRDVEFVPAIPVRADKETPDYVASITLQFAYPSAEDLLRLAHSLNTQWWLEFDAEQPGLINDKPAEGPPKRTKGNKGEQPVLTEEPQADA